MIFYHGFSPEMVSGREYFDHIHKTYELYNFIDGDIEYIIENHRYQLRPGDLLFIKPGEQHFFKVNSERQYERRLVNFPESAMPNEIVERLRAKGRHYAIGGTELEELMRRFDRHAAGYSGEPLKLLLESCLTELVVKFAYSEMEECPSERVNEQVSAIAKYISGNLHLPLTIDDVCRHFGVSRSYLFKAFTESFRESPKQYIINKKMMLAQRLLAQGERPTDVSEKCGFSDYSTFYRAFQRVIGEPPSGQARTGE